ncbi:hypothetical protein SRHO_G00177720 [Serrasalmus rhombeus]
MIATRGKHQRGVKNHANNTGRYFTSLQMADLEVVQKVLKNQGQLVGCQQQALTNFTQSNGNLVQQQGKQQA